MPTATLNKVNTFTLDLGSEVHNFTSDTLKIALTNTAPSVTNTQFSNITEISAGNGYTAGGGTLTSVTWTQTSGTATLDAATFTWTASGGSIGPFRYVVLYNDDAANDELIGWYDYGSSITLSDTEEFDFTVSSELLDIT